MPDGPISEVLPSVTFCDFNAKTVDLPETTSNMLCLSPELFRRQGNVRQSSVPAKMADVW